MDHGKLQVVTGALGYSGQAIAARLIESGLPVRTLTNSPDRPNPFGGRLEIRPLSFDNPTSLCDSLRGADVLYNTYWVRFNHRRFTFAQAVANTKALFAAARDAGVRRIVHISILHPQRGAGLAYYDGKLELERSLQSLGVSHAIIRPGVLFGRGDILVNNIAWMLRRLPVFGVFGDGSYEVQPMHVDDLAQLAVTSAAQHDDLIVDAVGPERFTFRQLVETLADILSVRPRLIRVSPLLGWLATRALGPWLGDVVLTREEIAGLMRSLLASDASPTGSIRLTTWAQQHRDELGRRYASELARRIDRISPYSSL